MRDRVTQALQKVFWNRQVTPRGLQHMADSLLDESTLDQDYIGLTIGACIIATLGLLSNSAAVIIGAMLIAPLMLPIRGVAFGALEGNLKLVVEGLKALVAGTAIALSLACILGWLVDLPYGSEIAARSQPNLLDLGVAVAAGAISAFAKIEPRLSSTLAGTAIAVALMPPVCVIGLGLSQADWHLTVGATLLYVTNLLGITLACMLIFLLSGYAPLARAQRALGVTIACVSFLGIPLGASFFELLHQTDLERSIKRALLDRTITFQRVQLIDISADWIANPTEITLRVYSDEPLTEKQAGLLEDFVIDEMGQDFHLIFQVSPYQEVQRKDIVEELAEPQ